MDSSIRGRNRKKKWRINVSPESVKGLSFVGLFVGALAFYLGLVSAFTCSVSSGLYSPNAPSCPTTFPTIAVDILPSVGIIALSILGFILSARITRNEAGGEITRQ
jgi:hypothetical protein